MIKGTAFDKNIYRHHSLWTREEIERDHERAVAQIRLVPAQGDKSQIKVNICFIFTFPDIGLEDNSYIKRR